MFQKQIWMLAVSALSMIAGQNSAAAARGAKFPLPHATVGLYVTGPNASGDVAGTFLTSGKKYGHAHGFVRLADGSFTTIDAPNSWHHNTTVAAFDDAGNVAGQYEAADNPNIDHAFLRTPDGTLTSFDAPGAYDTMPFDMNAHAGEMVGWYYAADGNHGFIRTLAGILTTIDYPAANGTYPYAVNSRGQITGTYIDSDGVRHGFLRQPGGAFKAIDPPNSSYTDNVAIDDSGGQISGIYQDSGSGMYFAFLRDRGTYYTFDRYFGRLNARHQAVGQTFLLSFRHRQFETTRVTAPHRCSGLFLSGINDSSLMAGSMQCGHGAWFGYLTYK